jgi:hypothetical protein
MNAEQRRLRALARHTATGAAPDSSAAAAAAAAAAAVVPRDPTQGAGPGAQGFGPRATTHPPHFRPDDPEEAAGFFSASGFCVLADTLPAADVAFLNHWLDAREAEHEAIGGDASAGPAAVRNPPGAAIGPYSANVLLREDAAALDRFVQNPSLMPFIDALWGEGNSRFSQFDMRWTKGGQGPAEMQFHHDVALPSRLTRQPYGPPDYVCSIIYLTDVDEDAPAFAVVPGSCRFGTINQAREELGRAYVEQPLYGKAGTCVFYDTATYHSRLDSLTGVKGRRTLHQYWARGGYLELPPEPGPGGETQLREPTPVHTSFVRIPQRLAAHPDSSTRLFYSHWSTGQGEWAARGYTGDGTLGRQERAR